MLEIDEIGLDTMDRRILLTLVTHFGGGPGRFAEFSCSYLGKKQIPSKKCMNRFLIQEGFLQRTARGRVALERTYTHLNMEKTETKFSREFVLMTKFEIFNTQPKAFPPLRL